MSVRSHNTTLVTEGERGEPRRRHCEAPLTCKHALASTVIARLSCSSRVDTALPSYPCERVPESFFQVVTFELGALNPGVSGECRGKGAWRWSLGATMWDHHTQP